MLRGSLFFLFVFFNISISFGTGDPNLNSYLRAGECSDISNNNTCGECPLKKLKITLPTNTTQATPTDEGFEVEEEVTEEGVN
ncbi:hypothetical protein [Bdellovibrio reynosensis]|uniref:Secreted protein n=1 Tax=Bdellovibrio reynosensis TaxID=2835041 RepID=A0ABY4CAI4_9BACT|nr:hypothetical protein [Bdellovibrio reynosensis]UOF00902.1 hypothetical protein MNR06_14465 [Bdellovibrio reynosensis]